MTCKSTRIHPNVAPGWGCCACKDSGRADGFIYNGERRKTCKVCGHARCDTPEKTTLREEPMSTYAAEHPDVMAIIRPEDPKRALASAKQLLQAQQDGSLSQDEIDRRYNEILQEQEYAFVGLLDPNVQSRILDPHTGETIGVLEPGDSFVIYADLLKWQQNVTPIGEA